MLYTSFFFCFYANEEEKEEDANRNNDDELSSDSNNNKKITTPVLMKRIAIAIGSTFKVLYCIRVWSVLLHIFVSLINDEKLLYVLCSQSNVLPVRKY